MKKLIVILNQHGMKEDHGLNILKTLRHELVIRVECIRIISNPRSSQLGLMIGSMPEQEKSVVLMEKLIQI